MAKIKEIIKKAIERGQKKFEVRNNDRNFQVHDMIYLEEVLNGEYTGRKMPPLEIQYILEGGQFGVQEGYCVLNWQPFVPPIYSLNSWRKTVEV